MSDNKPFEFYEQIAGITGQMLSAAQEGDWDLLLSLESSCSDHVNALRSGAVDTSATLTPAARERKIDFIKKILSDDKEIRAITEPRLHQLSSLLNSPRTERQLRQAYGANNAMS